MKDHSPEMKIQELCPWILAPLHKTQKNGKQTQNSKPRQDTWLLTGAGFNILLSMETYKWYYHLIHATRANAPHNFPYNVAGPLRDGGDVSFDIEGRQRLPDYRLLPKKIAPGELLALLNTGAYTVAQMFPNNGRKLPKVVLL
jgi:diaminopimelate decarboxylase